VQNAHAKADSAGTSRGIFIHVSLVGVKIAQLVKSLDLYCKIAGSSITADRAFL